MKTIPSIQKPIIKKGNNTTKTEPEKRKSLIALVAHNNNIILEEFSESRIAIQFGFKLIEELIKTNKEKEAKSIFVLDAESITEEEEILIRKTPTNIGTLKEKDHLEERWLHYIPIHELYSAYHFNKVVSSIMLHKK